MSRYSKNAQARQQRGAAILMMLILLGVIAAYVAMDHLNRDTLNARNWQGEKTLAQTREALLGFAAIYRDRNANQVFGYLPCPDINNDGISDTVGCGATDVSRLGRLPWKTLGLEALRDREGECFWYAISGTAKDNPKTAALNWDTLGQFIVQDADGNTLAGATAHERAWAVMLAPMAIRTGQNRGPASATVCGGNNTAAAYLDGGDPLYAGSTPPAQASSVITLATATSRRNGTNNDQGFWLTGKEVFERIKQRSDFKTDLDTLLGDLANCVNYTLPAVPNASPSNKGIDTLVASCPALGAQKINVLNNWKDNLLYTRPASAASVNGQTGCDAVLLFGGERSSTQSRSNSTEKDNATQYLEGSNATLFPNSGNYQGNTAFNRGSASTEIVRCLKGPPAGGARLSFANNFAAFTATGNLLSNSSGIRTYDNGLTANDNTSLLYFDAAAGTQGACFWWPTAIPLATKVIRASFNFTFAYADPFALTGTGSDRGSGFSVQLVRGDLGAPSNCGSDANMGVLDSTDSRGLISVFVETDVYRDAAHMDSLENHAAIMANGALVHSLLNGDLTTACNGSAAGCRQSPANHFEEDPLVRHQQRIEIHTGCNASCSSCNPASHAPPNNYARVTAWFDCVDCADTVVDLDRASHIPTVNRCLLLDTSMNSIYFGFTGGFRSGAELQGVKLENLFLRSE